MRPLAQGFCFDEADTREERQDDRQLEAKPESENERHSAKVRYSFTLASSSIAIPPGLEGTLKLRKKRIATGSSP